MGERQRGSTLAVAAVFTALLSALGLLFVLASEDEERMAINHLRGTQALYAAEAGARCVRSWLERPGGDGFLVPTVAQVNRSLRRVDPDGDGTSALWSAAAAPWNVVYRQGRDDLFERPYEGSPALSFEGAESGPDVRIARSGSVAERVFLDGLSDALLPGFPSARERARLARIDLFAPPLCLVAGKRVRFGVATIEVTAQLLRDTTAGEKEVASRTVRVVVASLPYAALPDPLAASGDIDLRSGVTVHWGAVHAEGAILLPTGSSSAVPSGWPWRAGERPLVPDQDADGTADDTDADGTADWDEWWLDPDDTIEDPWFAARARGALVPAPAPSQSNDQPWAFDPAAVPTGPSGPWTPDADRSRLVQEETTGIVPGFDYELWKRASREGMSGRAYYVWDPGFNAWREDGTGPPVTVQDATQGRSGLFFFDTTDGLAPADDNGDGTADNLAPGVVIGPGWWASGTLFVGAASLRFEGMGGTGRARSIPLPGEPCADLDGDGSCGSAEPFLQLDYPPDPLAPGAGFRRLALTTTAAGGLRRTAGPPVGATPAFEGLLAVGGDLVTGGDACVWGSVYSVRSVVAGGAGLLTILANPLLRSGEAPAAESGAPRTVTLSWETEKRASPLPAP